MHESLISEFATAVIKESGLHATISYIDSEFEESFVQARHVPNNEFMWNPKNQGILLEFRHTFPIDVLIRLHDEELFPAIRTDISYVGAFGTNKEEVESCAQAFREFVNRFPLSIFNPSPGRGLWKSALYTIAVINRTPNTAIFESLISRFLEHYFEEKTHEPMILHVLAEMMIYRGYSKDAARKMIINIEKNIKFAKQLR
jgi:hypothetical protein